MYPWVTHRLTLLLLIVMAVVCCRKEEVAPTKPQALSESPPITPAEPPMRPDTTSSADAGWPDTSVALEVEEEPDVGALLNKATTRQSCNIVMGCPAGATLIALGEDAVAPIIARYQSMGRPNYQKFHLLDLLGHIGSESALPLLRDELDASHWESRTRSALALGRIGSRRDLARLKTLLVKTENTQDYAFRYALACAVEKLAGEGGAEVLFEGLSPQAINSRNWGYTRVAVEAVAELELTSACPLLRVAVEHRDTFLKKAAMLATGALRCSDPALTQAVAAQLPSRVPSVRRQATATLRILTGITFSDYEQWQSYDRQN